MKNYPNIIKFLLSIILLIVPYIIIQISGHTDKHFISTYASILMLEIVIIIWANMLWMCFGEDVKSYFSDLMDEVIDILEKINKKRDEKF